MADSILSGDIQTSANRIRRSVSRSTPELSSGTKPRGRLGSVKSVRINATGGYVPNSVVTNRDLQSLGVDDQWVVRRTGITERRRADDTQATSDLAFEAAVRCMAEANIASGEVDLIIVSTVTPDHAFPSTASHLQRRLGAMAPAMDINAACSGFVYGLVTGAQFVAAGNAKCALVVGADVMTRMVNPSDQKTYPLFGDGAGAVLLGPDTDSQGGEILAYQIGSEGCGGETICVPGGGSRKPLTAEGIAAGDQYLRMDGRTVFKWAVRVVEESTTQVLAAAGVSADEVSLFVFHQANQRILDSAASSLSIPNEKVFSNLGRYGNTSAGSIPLAIDEAVLVGKVQRGDLVLVSGFGAGLTWGTALLRW